LPPTDRPIPAFLAEPPHELEPHGRWRNLLDGLFKDACEAIESEEDLGKAGPITWFPDRTYGVRTFLPARAPTEGGPELFGFVSFARTPDAPEPGDFVAQADYATEVAVHNPDWKLDLNDEVIARWHGLGEVAGDLTLVWGVPLVAGGTIATAELGDRTLDQCALDSEGRFTLVAVDAVSGFGDDLYQQVKLWNKRGELLASETLYEEEGQS
jgi:hypothetical protein